MADWKTYAKAARNTARKQAPGASRAVRESARRTSERAGDYVRAAERVVEENRSPHDERSNRAATRSDRDREASPGRPPGLDTDRWSRDAVAYATVAGRRIRSANLGARIARAVRDALLIGGSLLVIWMVLSAAGIQIPFTTVLLVVGVIVAIAFAGTLFAQSKRARGAAERSDGPE